MADRRRGWGPALRYPYGFAVVVSVLVAACAVSLDLLIGMSDGSPMAFSFLAVLQPWMTFHDVRRDRRSAARLGVPARYPAPDRDRIGLVGIVLVGLGLGGWWLSLAFAQQSAWRVVLAAAIGLGVAAVAVPAVLELRRGPRRRVS
ncbi:hypothetical protein [Nakamurella leprariae]|uniref:Transmembrane protein n=1 Tax=Nakamurella leprariae TaxID=2803911 RepID=A0A938YAR5_9ACTN|nr:hypothetical protein [Nakamurella leprariae]MBM9469081.1 hypothetical protein [Nakamurella leprariae]